MTILIGGHETGLLDSSLTLLNRNDRIRNGSLGQGEQGYVNVSNGNLLIQQRDIYLPSQGEDYALVRTYNARGVANDAHGHEDARWSFLTLVRLNVRNDGGSTYYEVTYGDGSIYEFRFDAARGVYVSTDGAGAYETLSTLGAAQDHDPAFVVTRANQTKLTFSKLGSLLNSVDTNAVRIDYAYEADRLVRVNDDQGHILNYIYENGVLVRVTDETAGVLVQYTYQNGRLVEVIDRFGHSTKYFYTTNGFLNRVLLPTQQTVNGQLETYAVRELLIDYDEINWRGDNLARAMVVKSLTDAEGGVTSFEYAFQFSQGAQPADKGHLKRPDGAIAPTDKFFLGGRTKVIDALGNKRATSNDAIYRSWRVANGYYDLYDANLAATNTAYQAQVTTIRTVHSLSYTYNANGFLTEVVDQQGFKTRYAYDAKENLSSIVDRNGFGATTSDASYFRKLRAELGYVDAGGQGKLVATLTQAEKDAILARFTTTFTYDNRGNLISRKDNDGNVTNYTYTTFNKLASETSAMGYALTTSDEAQYQQKRVELGYAALVANLTVANKAAILALYTTSYQYDVKQNVIQRTTPGGDITRFEYDVYGNVTRRIVFLDANDLITPAKQRITQYVYDAFGNNIETIDGEGHHTHSQFDHFGNLTSFTDGNGGITTHSYDADNRLLSTTDPEGHVTINRYDAVGNRISITDARGHSVVYLYDRNNLLIATVNNADNDATRNRNTTFVYDVIGNRTSFTDAEGRTSTYTYDTRRELVDVATAQVQDQNGNLTQFHTTYAYDGEGNRIRMTNNRGFTTEILYTPTGLIRQQTEPTGQVTRFSYDANYKQLLVIAGYQLPEAQRHIRRFSYDEEDQRVAETDAEGHTTHYVYDAPGNRVRAIDANGHATDFIFDRNNRLVKEIRPEVIDPRTGNPARYEVVHQFDANGNQTSTTDENGHTTRFSFDKDNRLVMVEDANGIKTVYKYDANHNRTEILIGVTAHLDATGHVIVDNQTDAQATRFVYDEFNQLIHKTDGVGNALAASNSALYQTMRQALGYAADVAALTETEKQALRNLFTEHYTYDRVGNYLSTADHLGHSTSFKYDALNRRIENKDALNQTTTYRYDGNGNRASQTDALGRVASFTYDANDRLTDSADALGVVAHQVYDTFGNLTSQTRAFGTSDARTTTYQYDLNNRLTRQTDPEGHLNRYEYDAVGNRLRVIDGRGNATQFVYDGLDRNIKIIDPLGFETRFEFDGVGNRLALIDARGGIARFTYDAGNRRIETTDGEGRVTHFTFDVRGNNITQTTAYGTAEAETTTYIYDAQNNLREVIDAEGKHSADDYDRAYNRISTTDGNGHKTTYVFDAVNRLIDVVDAEGGHTTYGYDAVGNRLQQTDALGHQASYQYDAVNRLITQTDSLGVETRYSYDRVGNQVAITHAANTPLAATTTFTYDRDNQLIAQTDALGHTTSFQYDANHNRISSTDALGHVTNYVYDANNRVRQIVDPLGNVVEYRYDGNGNRIQVVDARGFVSATYYNANNEVVLSVDNEGYATGISYDGNGNVATQTLYATALTLPLNPAVRPTPAANARDQVTQLRYDKINRVVERTDGEGFITQYAYDAVGNRTETRQALDVAATQFAVHRSYYDNINREVISLSAEGYITQRTYDAVGNVLVKTLFDQKVAAPADGSLPVPVAGDAGRTTRFQYDADNRLVRQTSALSVHTDYTYDARGNRTLMTEAAGTADARSTQYRYDAADRYIETTNAIGLITKMTLDANGNVLTRREAFGTAEERAFGFTYDGNDRVVDEIDPLGVITRTSYDAAGNVVSRTAAVGLPEARTESFTYDRNNRQIVAVNAAGDRVEYAYDAAGNRIRVTQAPGLPEARSNLFTYDRDNRLVEITDALGTKTQHRYDGAGNKITTIQAVGLPEQRQTGYVYDKDNRLTRVTDPMGGITRYEYDVLGNQTRITDANGGGQQNTFDAAGQVLSSLSAGNVLTSNTYDLRGNVIATTQSFADGSDARTSTYAYDLLNRQTLVTDGEGFSTALTYDAFGNQLAITHGLYLVPVGNPVYSASKAALAFAETNTFVYDAADRMLSMTDGEGNIIRHAYDAVGNRISTTEAANSAPRTTQFVYDLANRLIETRTPEGGITRNSYDHVGNKVSEDQLQSGSVATGIWIHNFFQYDKNGHLSAQIDPYGVRAEYTYDAIGNLVTQRAAAGTPDERTLRMEYDLNNRKTADIDALGNRTSYNYDSMGNRIKVTDALGRVAHFYFNGANQMTSLVDPERFINTFKFDATGNRIEERVFMTRASGAIDDLIAPSPVSSSQDRIVHLQYDRANRFVSRTDADGKRTELKYDGAGNKIAETTFANTTAPRTLTYAYDLNGRLTTFTDVDGTVTAFTYDGANNRLSEIVTNASDPNPVRATFYQYDLNNRRIRETFDPNGLNIILTTAYDKLANIVATTDGDNHTSTFGFDLNNRLLTQTDALGHVTIFAYDTVGNRVAITDARGETTRFVFDVNNRQTQEIQPLVQTYSISGGPATLHPTITKQYDAVGNEVQVTDANGFVTTRYFDGDNRLVAELAGDHVLQEYSFDAVGNALTHTLYMTRLNAADHDPAQRPTAPSGESRLTSFECDLAGRLTRAVYPSTEITTLANINTNNPTPVKVTKQVDERKVYDAFGNEVESFDRNGSRAVSYYDVKGRKVAVVDALGYLVEWDYDAQGNQIAQRVYAQALNPASVNAASRPTPPAGDVFETEIHYDAASRRIEEIGPEIEVFDPATQATGATRTATRYTYDRAGNQLTRTLGFGTPQAATEYSYYDAANRRIALVNSGRVLHRFQFDANGNLTSQKRFLDTIAASVNLSQLTGASDFNALVSADANSDEETAFTYDALNRLTQETDLMGPGAADDLSKVYRYDAARNRTYLEDEDHFFTQTSYDAANRVAETISQDGSGTLYEYDAAGNQIFVYTGKLDNAAAPASNLQARLTDGIALTWNVAGSNQRSWVVFDNASHTDIDDYASRTATQVVFTGTAQAVLTTPASGSTIYFRVVTQDGAGNLTWTGEQSLTVPPRFTAVSVAQPSVDTLVVTARFDAGVVSPALVYGASGNLTQSASFVLQPDGSYKATLSGLSNPAALSFKLTWDDAAGAHYSSAESPFAAKADQVGITSVLSQAAVTGGTKVSIATKVPTAYAAGLTVLQAQWRVAGSGAAFAATAVTGVDSGSGYVTFTPVMGSGTPLSAGTYEIVLSGLKQDGSTVLLDTLNFVVDGSATSSTQQSLSWIAPPAGDDQVVIIDGQRANSVRQDGRVLVDDTANVASASYQVFYSQRGTSSHTLDVTSAEHTESVPDPDDPDGPPITVVTGYDVGVQATLTAAEIANINGNLRLAWRPAGSGSNFAHDVTVPSTGASTFATTLGNLAAGQYDLKLYYTDSQDREVIVEWQRISTATPSSSFTGVSQTIVAREIGGTIARNAQGVLSLTPGIYSGPLDVSRLLATLTLNITPTGNLGGSRNTDGRETGYFIRNVYNELNYKIASNENDGLWRQFGVDGMDHRVETRLYGEEGGAAFIATYSAVDARGRTVAEFGAPVAGNAGLERPVRRYAYDVFDRTTEDTDVLGNTRHFEYNALGSLVRETDPLGGVKITRVDQFGRATAEVSQLGHTTLKFYDLQGRLIKERDPLGHETTYGYDAFNRKVIQTDGLGSATVEADDHSIHYHYDQRDRLVRLEQPQGWHLAHDNAQVYKDERARLGYAAEVASLSASDRDALIARYSMRYAYDGRNHVVSTFYPLDQRTDEVYDSVGRVVDTRVYLDGSPTHSRRAYDAYGNLIGETDAEDRTKTHIFGGFGRLLQDFDEDNNEVEYTYDIYGRITREFDPNGAKDIRKTYDDAGRLLTIQDLATGVSTTFTYDLQGKRLTEVVTTPSNAHNRNTSYQYDALGQLVRWVDGVTGLRLNVAFDAEGNRVRAYTDTGYDPLSKNRDANGNVINANYRYVDHVYTFDADRLVTAQADRTTDASGNVVDTTINGYSYDAAGNRITWNNKGTVTTYAYDANYRVAQGDYVSGSDTHRQTWTYDAMGNVLSFRTFKNGTQESATVTEYNDANRSTRTDRDGQVTTQRYDKSLRITQTTLQQDDKTYYYNYTYFGDGREKNISSTGDAKGNSTSTYDANKVRKSINLGQGDGQDRAEVKNFVADNEGHIIFEDHDDGKSNTHEIHEFVYANGNPVGQNGHGTDGVAQVQLDSDSYSPIQNLGDTFPGGNLSYTVREGDSLQNIAYQMYGNPSLWFVIADANGLSGNERLTAGTTLRIPNSVQTGYITAENHKVYSESEIVGSTLPNLKSPPPKSSSGCGAIIAIIIVVVIAIVVSVVTAGIAAPLAAGAVAAVGAAAGSVAAFVVTAAVYAAVGAVVAAIGSVVQQGLFIALDFQDEFSWSEVGSAAVAGALTSAAQGVGAAAKIAAGAGQLSAAGAQYAKIAAAALQTAGAAAPQVIKDGKITSWTSLAAAAVGGYASVGKEIAAGESELATAQAQIAKTSEALDKATTAAQAAQKAGEAAGRLSTISNYVSPWVQLAETYVRNDFKLTPADWATAAGSTLSEAVSGKFGAEGNSLGDNLRNASLRLGSNLLVAGVLSRYDKDAAQSYFENAVGQEAGQFIGDYIGQGLKQTVFKEEQKQLSRVYDPNRRAFVDAQTGELVILPSSSAQAEVSSVRVLEKDATGQYVDQYGNPTPLQYADNGQAQSDVASADATSEPAAPVIETRKIKPGDNYWNIAKKQLGEGASDADIQRQVYALMEANPGLDPRHIRIGQEINVISPNSGIEISTATIAAYRKSDAEYQAYRKEHAALALEQARLAEIAAALAAMPIPAVAESDTVAAEALQSPPLSVPNADEGFIPKEGVLGAVAGVGAGTYRFAENTVTGLWELGKTVYQSADYAITGDPASREGYDRVAGMAQGTVNLVSDSYDTYAYIITGEDKYRAGLERNADRGEAIIGAAQNAYDKFGKSNTYEKSAIVTEGVLTIASMFVGAGEARAAGETGAVLKEVKLLEEAAALAKGERVAAETAGAAGIIKTEATAANKGLGLVELDPNAVRFSQTTVKQQGATIPKLVESMERNGFVVEPDRLLDVVRMPDGALTTLDNTRVLAAQRAEVNIQARVFEHTDLLPNDANYVSRFIGRKGEVPVTFGDAVRNRIGNQNSIFRNRYPNGSPFIGSAY